jgi:AraC-like DNA-binding protein
MQYDQSLKIQFSCLIVQTFADSSVISPELPRLDRLTTLLRGLAPQVTLRPGSREDAAALPPDTRPALRLLLVLDGASDGATPHAQAAHEPALLVWRADDARIAWPLPAGAQAALQGRAALAGPMASLLLAAFDGVLVLPLASADPALQQAVQLIGTELQAPRCGGPLLLDRAGDILFIGLLRHLIAQPRTRHGLLNGLSDPRLARALVGAHSQPHKAWTLERLADEAGMSRTAFATRFRSVMDQTPGDYLFRLRMALARDGLQRGQALKQVAASVGYTPTSLSRALARRH